MAQETPSADSRAAANPHEAPAREGLRFVNTILFEIGEPMDESFE